MKSLLYILFIFIVWLVSFPLQAVFVVFIFVTIGPPVFFRQKRIGKNGKPFIMYKFRTMKVHTEKDKARLMSVNESDGPTFKMYHDPRFTPVGKFLSHTGLDELPQLWNVLRGEMALLGPRPFPVEEAKKLKPWMRARHAILPGIISPAILTGRYHKDFDAWMKSDVQYAETKNIRTDAVLIGRAVFFLVRLFVTELFRFVVSPFVSI